jgi:hypothetical protein
MKSKSNDSPMTPSQAECFKRTSVVSETKLVAGLRRRPSPRDDERTRVKAKNAKDFIVKREGEANECNGALIAFCV